MRKRFRKLMSGMLVFALVFTMSIPAFADPVDEVAGAIPASEAAIDEAGNGEMTVMSGGPAASGNPVTYEGWTASDAGENTTVKIYQDSDGYGLSVRDDQGDCVSWNTTISGNAGCSGPLFIIANRSLDTGDSIILDVDMTKGEGNDEVTFFVNKECFTDETKDSPDDIIIVTPNPGTNYRMFENENCWVYIFSKGAEPQKEFSVGGWTVTDKNIDGDSESFVSGGEDSWEDGDSYYWMEVVSPTKDIDTTLTGSLESEHLDWFMVLNKESTGDEDFRELNEKDRILIDVTNSANDDWVQVGIPLENFKEGATVEDILKIVKIKEEPGVYYEAGKDTDGGDNYFYINFLKTNDQEMIDLVTRERKSEEGTETRRTQVVGDTIPVIGKKDGKKWTFSITGLKEQKGDQFLTVNAGITLTAEDLKGLDKSGITLSFNNADGTTTPGNQKDVKKFLTIDKKGKVKTKWNNKEKKCTSCTLNIPVGESILHLTVVNIGFDKKTLKEMKISSLQGEGSTVSINLVQLAGKEVRDASEFLTADWMIDGKTEVKTTDPTKPATAKCGLNVYLSEDYRTLTIFNPGNVKKGAVSVKATINGKKYTTKIKVKLK